MNNSVVEGGRASVLPRDEIIVAELTPKKVLAQADPISIGYVDLRTARYKELGYIPDELGDDRDADDERSAHFVALTSGTAPDAKSNAVGSMRLIKRGDSDNQFALPIENLFKGSLETDTGSGTVEISRLISTGEQHIRVLRKLFRAALSHVLADGETTQTLAVVDVWFMDYLANKQMVPLRKITPAKKFDQYPSKQVGIEVDFPELYQRMQKIGEKTMSVVELDGGIKYYEE